MTKHHEYFVTCAPGVEQTLFQEMKSLRLSSVECQVGGVYFRGTVEDSWLANLQLRTAIRVLRRLKRFQAPDDDTLYNEVRGIDWSPFLDADGEFFVDAQCSESNLDHSQFIAQRTKDAIVDEFREQTQQRPSVAKENADLRIHVHLWRDRCTLAVDTSGDSLHKRGWRKYQGRAPMAETLAAAVILLSKWDQRSPLVDPFCGSGTLLIEAAMMARKIAPGSFRQFGFEKWPEHQPRKYKTFRENILAQADWKKKVFLFGRDQDADRLDGARANAETAGVGMDIQWDVGDALEFPFKKRWGAWVVSNLPYGKRIEEEGLQELHHQWGNYLRRECEGYHISLLVGERTYAHALGFQNWDETKLRNGSLRCSLVNVDL